MRGRLELAALAALALAACNDKGVSIEVHAGTSGATHVELYLSDGDCVIGGQPCPDKLTTPSSGDHLPGKIHIRDNATTLSAPVESDGIAYFTVVPGDRDFVPRAFAIGFIGETVVGGATMVEFSTTDPHRRIVTLAQVVDTHVTGAPSDGLRIEIWREASGAGCVAFEKQHGGAVEREFIVPASDPDCDDFVAPLECDDFWPDFAAPVDPARRFTCVEDDSTGTGLKACRLGSSGACTDGSPRSDCAPQRGTDGHAYCVPAALCVDAPIGCKGGAQGCAFGRLQNSETLTPKQTRLHCRVPVEPFNADSNQTCNGEAEAAFVPTFQAGTAACTGASVGPVLENGFGPFLPTQNNLDVLVTPDCHLTLTFSEQFAIADTQYLPDYVLKVDLANSHSVIVPLFIELVPAGLGCQTGGNATCELEGPLNDPADESFIACSRLP